jgi:ABC-type transport system involved in cytochrome c biogenesis permease subunit
MKCPPYLVSMRIQEQERTKFRLWFPLFILWPLLAVFVLLTVIAALLADLFSLVAQYRPGYTHFLFGVLGVVGETRGTEVFVQDKTHNSRTVALTLR